MRFVADESCDFAVVRALRAAGFEVWAVAESAPQSGDDEVLERAAATEAILVTEDRDFGRLVFREGRRAFGVILLRYAAPERLDVARLVVELAVGGIVDLSVSFVTVTPRGIRVRPLPGV